MLILVCLCISTNIILQERNMSNIKNKKLDNNADRENQTADMVTNKNSFFAHKDDSKQQYASCAVQAKAENPFEPSYDKGPGPVF